MNLPDAKVVRIRTQAGGALTNENINSWLNPSLINPMEDATVVDVYVEQVCYYVNQSRGLLEIGRPGNCMRAMLSQPQSFYTALLPPDGQATGSQMLRAAGISTREFRQLEYFFIPINFNEHSSLIIVSPLDWTVELADSNERSDRAMSKIFHVIIRFLIHELGELTGPFPWRFLHGQTPIQKSKADCGNYTCLFAKALALQRPLTRDTDVGQGADGQFEGRLKELVMGDLQIGQWTEDLFPFGNEDPTARHYAPNTASVPQHRLFCIPDMNQGRTATELRRLRSRTGRHDRKDRMQLIVWCLAQPPLYNHEGNAVSQMLGLDEWASMSLPDFVSRVEEREADILNGLFP